jgi:flavodoxin
MPVNVLVVADSAYGNTWSVAGAVSEAFEGSRLLHTEQAGAEDLNGVDLLIVGSPTQGGRPLATVQAFIAGLPEDGLKASSVAAFDTRVDSAVQALPMRLLLRLIGYAAPRIAGALTARGGRLAAPPEGFIVEGKEGPLRAGELERAQRWARALLQPAER